MTLFVWPPQNINTTGLATEAKQDTIIGHIDGLETLVTSTNTKLDTIDGHVDGIETLVTSTNTKLDTIAGYVDGIEGALTTLNAKDFATETTLQKTRKWPYATFAKIVLTSGVSDDVYAYKTSGDVTVGTITVTRATGLTVYSPDKVV